MDKHAFLIIAHNEFEILQRLVSALDNERVDIYVHIDKKVKELPVLSSSKSNLYVLNERVDTRWGDVSQIETEYTIFSAAFSPGKYVFYHLISGVHYPLKDINEILSFYDKFLGKTIFQGLCKESSCQEGMKVRRYNLFTRVFAYGSDKRKHFVQLLWRLFHILQKALNVYRFSEDCFYKANNWASFSDNTLSYLLYNKDRILEKYKWSFCGDEFFAPTELFASSFESEIVSLDSILYQIFGDASPRILTMEDYQELMLSNYLFARKVSSSSLDLVDKIDETVRRLDR